MALGRHSRPQIKQFKSFEKCLWCETQLKPQKGRFCFFEAEQLSLAEVGPSKEAAAVVAKLELFQVSLQFFFRLKLQEIKESKFLDKTCQSQVS